MAALALLLLALLPGARARWGSDAHGVLELNGMQQLRLVEKAQRHEQARGSEHANLTTEKMEKPSLHDAGPEKAWVAHVWDFLNSRALQTIVPVFTIQMVFLAPTYTLFQRTFDKRTGRLSLFPYTLMICNGLAWAIYGSIIHDVVLAIGYAFGVALGAIYFMTAYIMSREGAVVFHHLLVIALTILLGIMAVLFTGHQAADIMGYTALFITVPTLTGPFSSFPKKTEPASGGTIAFFKLAAIVNALAWIGYGYRITENLFVYLPNIVGLFIFSLEFVAFVCMSFKTSATKANKSDYQKSFGKQIIDEDDALLKKKKHKKSVSFKFEEGQPQWDRNGVPYFLR